jgi:hypothetical protein
MVFAYQLIYKDEKQLAADVKKFAQLLRSDTVTKPIKQGDMSIVKANDNRFVFARVDTVPAVGNIKVFTNSYESESISVARNDVFILTHEMRQNLKDIKIMEKMVRDQLDLLVRVL